MSCWQLWPHVFLFIHGDDPCWRYFAGDDSFLVGQVQEYGLVPVSKFSLGDNLRGHISKAVNS